MTELRRGAAALVLILVLPFMINGCAGKHGARGQEDGLELTILHTNDTHSRVAGFDEKGNACLSDENCTGGSGRIAAAIRSAKEKNDNVIALDAGDQFQGTLFFTVNKWPMLAEIDAHIPYDAMTLGNHEFDDGCLELEKFTETLKFPVLAANLAPEKGCPLLKSPVKPYIVREVRGVKVGIIGLANDEVRTNSKACEHTLFTKAQETLSKTAKELKAQGVNVIVAVTHLGLPEDRRLARSVDDVDVIVGGHTHSYIGPGSEEGPYPVVERSPSGAPVLVVTAKYRTQYLGELDVKFDRNGVPVSWSGGPIELKPSYPSDPEIRAIVKKYEAKLTEFTSEKITTLEPFSLPGGDDACRRGECLEAMLLADAMLDYGRPEVLAPCPRRLYRCPKSLEIVFRYWSFCHNHSPYYFLQFTFLFRYVYTVHSISLNNSVHSSKGIVKGQKKKQDNPAFSEIYLFGDFNRNLKSTIFTMGNQNRSVMTICDLLYNQQP